MRGNNPREEFLDRVRKSLLGGEIAPVRGRRHPPASQSSLSAERMEALSKRFQEELARVGGHVFVAKDAEQAKKYLAAIAGQHGARLAVRWDDALLAELGIDAALTEAGVEVVVAKLRAFKEATEGEEARAYLKGRTAEADMGISGAHYAIADTGTLVLIAGEGQARSVTALPPVHVAVLEARRLVASADEFFAIVGRKEESLTPALASCISFITGPSRTGDIELALTIGVHGPRELHVILLTPGLEHG